MKVLVTGGVRSGKSHHAETLVRGEAAVTYVAPGPDESEEPDPDWALRLAAHRDRRPASWTTVETADVATAIADSAGPVLVDCLGTWLTRTIDLRGLWEAPVDEVTDVVRGEIARLVAALERPQPIVLVTNEVGLGVVPAHRSGRLFRDLLGEANRQVAAACDEVHLVIAGRVLVL
ncbi:bifunctional adenosylcobinamide kinase/adenosylcobinamide-phosphate guanylyltransferase [Ornithinimicrobium faecis]|uniref:Adenosylcobinamide kinase n=1 Tax=Ornithinimicrobium faecis TaxID=2934158 RepID=A0ABY4YW49_9MICO|nr:bifunctional adenosylcobinamide kinase/adenosylcobinamide-phosphate guanylyltransferase [Ornithinimicrobium sp. HY1793]USQ80992.1 bifunctional adenosylcobinamide kinase/adenosylcobinamide-phosphate guanylyltransferase [Ornithinimicrobium sp. HY1793]